MIQRHATHIRHDVEPRLALASDTAETVYCSFCGKHGDDLEYMVVKGPVAICNRCLAVCVEMAQAAGFPITSQGLTP